MSVRSNPPRPREPGSRRSVFFAERFSVAVQVALHPAFDLATVPELCNPSCGEGLVAPLGRHRPTAAKGREERLCGAVAFREWLAACRQNATRGVDFQEPVFEAQFGQRACHRTATQSSSTAPRLLRSYAPQALIAPVRLQLPPRIAAVRAKRHKFTKRPLAAVGGVHSDLCGLSWGRDPRRRRLGLALV